MIGLNYRYISKCTMCYGHRTTEVVVLDYLGQNLLVFVNVLWSWKWSKQQSFCCHSSIYDTRLTLLCVDWIISSVYVNRFKTIWNDTEKFRVEIVRIFLEILTFLFSLLHEGIKSGKILNYIYYICEIKERKFPHQLQLKVQVINSNS